LSSTRFILNSPSFEFGGAVPETTGVAGLGGLAGLTGLAGVSVLAELAELDVFLVLFRMAVVLPEKKKIKSLSDYRADAVQYVGNLLCE
jgi:hypothetical protein